MKAFLAALIATTGLIASTAQAATIDVTTTDECGVLCNFNNDSKCSFGEAIFAINTRSLSKNDCLNSSSDTFGNNDTINLIAGATFNFTRADHTSPVGPTALPTIRRSVTIHGLGAKLTHEENDNGFVAPLRFFEISTEPQSDYDDLPEQIQVFWDDTTFDGGNPDCFCSEIDIKDIKATTENLIETQAVACQPATAGDQCYSGGAGYVRGSGITTTFDKTTFKNNKVRTTFAYEGPLGGAVFLDNGAFGVANFSRSLFLSNKAPAGGAIYAGVGTQLSVTESTFAGNKAQVERDTSLDDDLDPDPVIDALDTADSKMGGAIYAEGPVVSVNNSAFYSNQGGVGGALALRGATSSVLNSTFFKNSAELLGGAIATAPIPFNYRDLNGPWIPNSSSNSNFSDFAFSALIQSPTLTLDHVTMVENMVGQGSAEVSAVSAGGGIANLGAGTVALRHSIIANNTAVGGASGANCYGNFISLGQNDLHWPNFDPSCVVTQAPGAEPDHHKDPILKKCNEDMVNAGKASCDPEPTSPMIDGAISCPAEDQHHDTRNPELCTVGAIEYAKTCDDGVTHDDEDCPAPTEPEGSICGNGIVETGEQCDDGEAGNSNEPNATCRTDCRTQRCGDGIVDTDAGEVCDSDITCFECQAVVTPSGACAITEEDLLDPSLKTNDDLIDRFGFDAVSKCLNVFGGASSCSLTSGSVAGNDWGTLLTFAAGALPLIWRRKK